MAHRVSPTDRIRGHIDELSAQGRPPPEILEEVARLGTQLLMQAALEAESGRGERNGGPPGSAVDSLQAPASLPVPGCWDSHCA